ARIAIAAGDDEDREQANDDPRARSQTDAHKNSLRCAPRRISHPRRLRPPKLRKRGTVLGMGPQNAKQEKSSERPWHRLVRWSQRIWFWERRRRARRWGCRAAWCSSLRQAWARPRD